MITNEEKNPEIRIKLDLDLKRRFQVKCVETGTKMTPVVQQLVEDWVNDEQQLTAARNLLQSLIKGERPSNALIVEAAGHLKIKTDELLDLCDRLFPTNNDRKPDGCNSNHH